MKLLIIPDAHAHPKYDNARFEWLGRLLQAEKPDTVVCLGDFADMPSLSAYDRGKRGFEGRRYKSDIEITRDALAKLGPKPRNQKRIMCLGNHEDRINRATNDHSELDGTIGIVDLGYAEAGWRVVPYQASVDVAGWRFSHHFASGIAGRPIGGVNAAANLIRTLHQSACVGHSHVFDVSERTRPDGSKVVGLVAGCYAHRRQVEGWNAGTQHMYWNGITILDDARDGYYGALRCITQDRIRKLYGSRKEAK
jgi:predicted phosphodiesterase